MSKIIVAGGGHGGLVAAIKLSRAGHDVTVFEQKEKGSVGMAQTDAFDGDTFTYADIPPAPYFKRGSNTITFVPSDNSLEPLTVPGTEELSYIVDRRELAEYLISLAEESGVEIRFGCHVEAPIVLGNRVAGIRVSSEDIYGDLIIDACGINSPVRSNLPDFLFINREIKRYDAVYSYRAYFSKNPDEDDPITNYNLYLREDGTVGFNWLITEIDRTDVLICRFHQPEDDEILLALRTLQEENPHMGLDLVYGGSRSVIPVCHPLGIFVCDGYAAVGDSAFMTIPLKGSGITYSFKAGSMLADCIINDTDGFFDTESLWEYQTRFFKEIGFGACRLAIIKNILPYLTAEQVNEMFRLGITDSTEISEIMTDKAGALFSKQGIASVKNKLKLVSDNATLRDILSNLAVWVGKFTVTEASYPAKYDRKSAAKWIEKYNDFFDGIRKPD